MVVLCMRIVIHVAALVHTHNLNYTHIFNAVLFKLRSVNKERNLSMAQSCVVSLITGSIDRARIHIHCKLNFRIYRWHKAA